MQQRHHHCQVMFRKLARIHHSILAEDRGRWLRFLIATLWLNLALGFGHAWPSLWPLPVFKISLEFVGLLLIIVVATAPGRLAVRGGLSLLTLLLCLVLLARYGWQVGGGLYGKPLNFYWDLRHLPSALAMLAEGLSGWQELVALLAAALALLMLYLAVAWGLACLRTGLAIPGLRRWTVITATGIFLSYFITGMAGSDWQERLFAEPLTPRALQSAGDFMTAMSEPHPTAVAAASRQLAAKPIGEPRGDVFLFFIESYGATAYLNPRHRLPLSANLKVLAQHLHTEGFHLASAYLDAPTFGGGSWLSHASALSGLRITNEGAYRHALRLSAKMMGHRLSAMGYDTVAVVPGIRSAWPEGKALGFAEIADAATLGYRGPAYGWWRIPDQFSLAWLRRRLRESAPDRAPVFAFFAGISSHIPFSPLPPYVTDWEPLSDPAAFPAQAAAARVDLLEWQALNRAYLASLSYSLQVAGDFVVSSAGNDGVMLLLGDHQPPAIVSGPAAPWLVPFHVISRDQAVIERFVAQGLTPGFIPQEPALGGIELLYGLLFRALWPEERPEP